MASLDDDLRMMGKSYLALPSDETQSIAQHTALVRNIPFTALTQDEILRRRQGVHRLTNPSMFKLEYDSLIKEVGSYLDVDNVQIPNQLVSNIPISPHYQQVLSPSVPQARTESSHEIPTNNPHDSINQPPPPSLFNNFKPKFSIPAPPPLPVDDVLLESPLRVIQTAIDKEIAQYSLLIQPQKISNRNMPPNLSALPRFGTNIPNIQDLEAPIETLKKDRFLALLNTPLPSASNMMTVSDLVQEQQEFGDQPRGALPLDSNQVLINVAVFDCFSQMLMVEAVFTDDLPLSTLRDVIGTQCPLDQADLFDPVTQLPRRVDFQHSHDAQLNQQFYNMICNGEIASSNLVHFPIALRQAFNTRNECFTLLRQAERIIVSIEHELQQQFATSTIARRLTIYGAAVKAARHSTEKNNNHELDLIEDELNNDVDDDGDDNEGGADDDDDDDDDGDNDNHDNNSDNDLDAMPQQVKPKPSKKTKYTGRKRSKAQTKVSYKSRDWPIGQDAATQAALRDITARFSDQDPAVQAFIAKNPLYKLYISQWVWLQPLIEPLQQKFQQEDKKCQLLFQQFNQSQSLSQHQQSHHPQQQQQQQREQTSSAPLNPLEAQSPSSSTITSTIPLKSMLSSLPTTLHPPLPLHTFLFAAHDQRLGRGNAIPSNLTALRQRNTFNDAYYRFARHLLMQNQHIIPQTLSTIQLQSRILQRLRHVVEHSSLNNEDAYIGPQYAPPLFPPHKLGWIPSVLSLPHPSSFFFIDNTFFDDRRSPLSVSLSDSIIAFSLQQHYSFDSSLEKSILQQATEAGHPNVPKTFQRQYYGQNQLHTSRPLASTLENTAANGYFAADLPTEQEFSSDTFHSNLAALFAPIDDIIGNTPAGNNHSNKSLNQQHLSSRQQPQTSPTQSHALLDNTTPLHQQRHYHPGIGIFKQYKQETTRFRDISFRLGEQYLFQHQGNCQHIVIFSNMRIRSAEDPNDKRMYPRVLFRAQPHKAVFRHGLLHRFNVAPVNNVSIIPAQRSKSLTNHAVRYSSGAGSAERNSLPLTSHDHAAPHSLQYQCMCCNGPAHFFSQHDFASPVDPVSLCLLCRDQLRWVPTSSHTIKESSVEQLMQQYNLPSDQQPNQSPESQAQAQQQRRSTRSHTAKTSEPFDSAAQNNNGVESNQSISLSNLYWRKTPADFASDSSSRPSLSSSNDDLVPYSTPLVSDQPSIQLFSQLAQIHSSNNSFYDKHSSITQILPQVLLQQQSMVQQPLSQPNAQSLQDGRNTLDRRILPLVQEYSLPTQVTSIPTSIVPSK